MPLFDLYNSWGPFLFFSHYLHDLLLSGASASFQTVLSIHSGSKARCERGLWAWLYISHFTFENNGERDRMDAVKHPEGVKFDSQGWLDATLYKRENRIIIGSGRISSTVWKPTTVALRVEL